jgi:hypothetical protein
MFRDLARATACVLVFAALPLSVAQAGVAVGGGFGISQFEYDNVDDGSARLLHIAYEVDESPLYFEFALVDSGDADITDSNSLTINVSGNQFGLGYRFVSNQETGTGFYLKGGFYSTDTEISDPDGELCGVPCKLMDDNNGLYIGFGGDLMFNPSFGVRFDMQGLLGVEDFQEDNNVTVITIGPVIRFGTGQQ